MEAQSSHHPRKPTRMSRRGASLMGYALIVGLVAILAIGATGNIGQRIIALFGNTGDSISGVASSGDASSSPSASPVASAISFTATSSLGTHALGDALDIQLATGSGSMAGSAISAGSLPAGLALNTSSTGELRLAGTLDDPSLFSSEGAYGFTVTAQDAASSSDSMAFTLTIDNGSLVTGLVAEYSFDNISGSTVIDEVAGANASLSGITTVSGQIGDAGHNDGQSTGQRMVISPGILNPDTAFSYAYWINQSAYASASSGNVRSGYVELGDPSGGNGFVTTSLPASPGPAFFFAWRGIAGGHKYSLSDSPLNQWNLVVVTANGSSATTPEVKMYVNGSQLAPTGDHTHGGSLSNNETVIMNTSSVHTGLDAAINGSMDQIRFWSRELTPAEVTALYNGGNGL